MNDSEFLKKYSPKLEHQKDVFKELQDKYGSYNRLALDIKILFFMISENLKTNSARYIRQKEIIDRFPEVTPGCIRTHLYRLKKRCIIEDVYFKGCYKVNVYNASTLSRDLNKLLEALVGEEIYNFIKGTM